MTDDHFTPDHPSVTLGVRVVSRRAGGRMAALGETIIDVDRTHPVLGNPFVLRNHLDDVERKMVIDQYRLKLEADLKIAGPMSRALDALAQRAKGGERLALRCWCAPKKCHAELLREQIFFKLGLEPEEALELTEKSKASTHRQMGLF